jgi:Holliday junction resolvase RusA-like endonuclease
MTITIPEIPPSLNRFAGRKNEWEYRALKQRWKDMVYLACVGKGRFDNKVVITITYYFPDRRRRDPDNFQGKMIMDGLTAAGVIRDDSFDCIELRLRGGDDKANPRTEIRVEP